MFGFRVSVCLIWERKRGRERHGGTQREKQRPRQTYYDFLN